MIIALLYLLSTLIAPAPLTSMTVDPHPAADRLDVVVHFLNSDTRYTDFALTVGDVSTPISAPPHVLQTITTTLPLELPPICNTQAVYTFVVTARVLTDTLAFAQTEVGGVAVRLCPYRVYLP